MFGYYRFRPHHYLIVFGIGVVVGFLLCAHMKKAHAGTLDLDITVGAIHTRAWARRTLNQVNPGAGIEYHLTRTWGVMGGEYLNSYRHPTWYEAATYTPLHLGGIHHWRLDAGIAGGLASGYTRRENPYAPLMAAGLVRLRAPDGLGVNLLWVPNTAVGCGFVGFQIAVPLH